MIKHIVMWTLKNKADAPHFKAQLDTCSSLVAGMRCFEVAIRTPAREGNCDVVLYSEFDNAEALASYQNHPHHKQISDGLGPLRDTRSALDYHI